MMPYAKKRSRSQSRGRTYKKSRTTRSSRGRRTNVVVLKSSGELKGADTGLSRATAIEETTNSNAKIMVLNGISPGSASYNRIGRKIRMQSIRVTGHIQTLRINEAVTGDMYGNYVRMVIVYDKQPSDALPNFDTIFGRTLTSGIEDSGILENLRYDNTGRFRVYMDEKIEFPAEFNNLNAGTADRVRNFKLFDKYVKLPNLPTVYSGQSIPTTIADISSGALYFIIRAYIDDSTQTEMYIDNATARLRYYDN